MSHNEKDKSIKLFRDAPVSKAVLFNVIPSIISMLMVLVYNLADTFFIGKTQNSLMLAAVSIATPAFLLFMAIGMLFGIGGTSLISRMLGEGNIKRARKVSSFCFWTGLSIGLVSLVFIYIFSEKISYSIGANSETIGYTRDYLKIVAFGIPFLIISNCFSNVIRSEGKAAIAMAGMIIGNLTNIVLDPVMILGLDWGVRGAAIATVLGNVVAALFYFFHLISKNTMLSIKPSDYVAGQRIALDVFAIGIPASLNSILMSVSNIVINNKMEKFGNDAVAGLGIAMKVNMIVVMLLIGLGTGVQPLLGYCFGSGNKKRFFKVFRFSAFLALSLSAVMTVICYAGASFLVEAFMKDPSTYDYAFSFSRIYILSGPILGMLFLFINAIQSTGAAIPSLILSVSRQGLLYLPILHIISRETTSARMLAFTQPLTDYLATLLAFVLFIITSKKYFEKRTAIK